MWQQIVHWITSSVHENCKLRTCCVHELLFVLTFRTIHVQCTQHVFMYWTCNSMNNLSSYCGLVDAKIRASDKDLPVVKIKMAKPDHIRIFGIRCWIQWAKYIKLLIKLTYHSSKLWITDFLFIILSIFSFWRVKVHPRIYIFNFCFPTLRNLFEAFVQCYLTKELSVSHHLDRLE